MKQEDLIKINSLLFFIFAVIAALYFGAAFLIPLTFAAFLAALMTPVSNVIEKGGLGRAISSLLSTLIVLVVVGGLTFLLFYQLRLFTNDLPQIREELKSFFETIQQQLSATTGLSPEEQRKFLQERSDPIVDAAEKQATGLLGNVVTTSLKFLLVLVYIFLLLLYRDKFKNFVMKYVPSEKNERAHSIMSKTSKVVFHYLWGRIKVMSILAVMYLAAFIIFDVPYTILLTIFGALITIIPYIGPFISGLVPICFVIIFGRDFSEVLLFSSVILVIQLIESYVLEPIIIGSEVQLNPLFVIIAIIIGGAVWGMAGMILFVPIFSILKIIFDHIPNLKPLGYLFGDTKSHQGGAISKKIKTLFTRISP